MIINVSFISVLADVTQAIDALESGPMTILDKHWHRAVAQSRS